jgi:hypothetical protein
MQIGPNENGSSMFSAPKLSEFQRLLRDNKLHGGEVQWHKMNDELVIAAARKLSRWSRRMIRNKADKHVFLVDSGELVASTTTTKLSSLDVIELLLLLLLLLFLFLLLFTDLVDGTFEHLRKNRKGMAALGNYIAFTATFFIIIWMQRPIYNVFSVESGIMDAIESVGAVGSTVNDVGSTDDIYDWVDTWISDQYQGKPASMCHAKCTAGHASAYPVSSPGGRGRPLNPTQFTCAGSCWSDEPDLEKWPIASGCESVPSREKDACPSDLGAALRRYWKGAAGCVRIDNDFVYSFGWFKADVGLFGAKAQFVPVDTPQRLNATGIFCPKSSCATIPPSTDGVPIYYPGFFQANIFAGWEVSLSAELTDPENVSAWAVSGEGYYYYDEQTRVRLRFPKLGGFFCADTSAHAPAGSNAAWCSATCLEDLSIFCFGSCKQEHQAHVAIPDLKRPFCAQGCRDDPLGMLPQLPTPTNCTALVAKYGCDYDLSSSHSTDDYDYDYLYDPALPPPLLLVSEWAICPKTCGQCPASANEQASNCIDVHKWIGVHANRSLFGDSWNDEAAKVANPVLIPPLALSLDEPTCMFHGQKLDQGYTPGVASAYAGNQWKLNSAGDADHYELAGNIAGANKILGGVLVSQTRFEQIGCNFHQTETESLRRYVHRLHRLRVMLCYHALLLALL